MLSHDGYQIIFLDPSQEGVDLINSTESYKVREIDESGSVVNTATIGNYKALHMLNQHIEIIQETSTADVVVIYQDDALASYMSPLLARAIFVRNGLIFAGYLSRPLTVIRYSRAWKRYDLHAEQLGRELAQRIPPDRLKNTYADTVSYVDRILPRGQSLDTLDVTVESFHRWYISTESLEMENWQPAISRATFTTNPVVIQKKNAFMLAMVATAVFAFNTEYYHLHDAIRAPSIERKVHQLLNTLHPNDSQILITRLRTPASITCYESAKLPRWNLKYCITQAAGLAVHRRKPLKIFLPVIEHTLSCQGVEGDLESQKLGHNMRNMSAQRVYQSLQLHGSNFPYELSIEQLGPPVMTIIAKIQTRLVRKETSRIEKEKPPCQPCETASPADIHQALKIADIAGRPPLSAAERRLPVMTKARRRSPVGGSPRPGPSAGPGRDQAAGCGANVSSTSRGEGRNVSTGRVAGAAGRSAHSARSR
ncbi:hypothetical protein HC762_00370 [bacterium]|nr:hypothetical protein [bacterium]